MIASDGLRDNLHDEAVLVRDGGGTAEVVARARNVSGDPTV